MCKPISLKWNIINRLFFPLMACLIIYILVPIIPLYQNISGWGDQAGSFLKNSNLKTLEISISKKAEDIGIIYSHVINDLITAENYSQTILSGDLPIIQPYRLYSGDPTIEPIAPPTDYEGIQKFPLNFKLGVTSLTELYSINSINETNLMNNVMRALYKSSYPLYSQLYVGVESNGLFTLYPYSFVTGYTTLSYQCEKTKQPTTGYDPRCRSWYVISSGTPSVKFSSPYLDATTQKILISASKAIYRDNVLWGVIGFDFEMDTLDSLITENQQGSSRYLFLIDINGNVISYPNLDRSQPTSTIFQKEPQIPTAIWTTILQTSDNFGHNLHAQKGNQMWLINYARIPISNQFLVMMSPESEIDDLIGDLNSDLSLTVTKGTIAITIILIVLGLITFYISLRIGQHYTRPYNELSEILDQMTQANLDVQLGHIAPISSEVKTIYNNINKLLVAVKFGNEAYYSGNLNKALADYNLAEQMMREMNNLKGLGVCYNNKANVLKQLGRPKEAEDLYLKAIELAQQLYDSTSDPKEKIVYKVILGKRRMNLGVLYKEINQVPQAIEQFNISRGYHREADDHIGIARVTGNLSQLYMQINQLDQAEDLIVDLYNTYMIQPKRKKFMDAINNGLRSRQYLNRYERPIINLSDISRLLDFETDDDDDLEACVELDDIFAQHILMNLGLLYEAYKDVPRAIIVLNRALTSYEKVDYSVQQICIEHLIACYDSIGDLKSSQHLREIAHKEAFKNVLFALDTSGSMEGTPIRKCRANIEEIVTNYMTNGDHVSLTVFSERSKVLFPLISRSENYDYIIDTIRHKTPAGGQTACFDAIYDGLLEVQKSNNSGSDQTRSNYLMCLTDGADTSSKHSLADVDRLLSQTNVCLIMITIGDIPNENYIRSMCQRNKGYHIKIGVNSIEEAFKKVVKIITGQVNVEVL